MTEIEEVYVAFEKLSDKNKAFVLEMMSYLQSENEKEWMTVREAGLRLGMSPTSIRRLIEDGTIRSKNVAERKTMVAVTDIESLEKGRKIRDEL